MFMQVEPAVIYSDEVEPRLNLRNLCSYEVRTFYFRRFYLQYLKRETFRHFFFIFALRFFPQLRQISGQAQCQILLIFSIHQLHKHQPYYSRIP